ncbi:hypothetical protein [Metallosphaera sedula]|uniref:hypothetical protein n=1 Tax=Metallosphaera sedula TaxID=43687 RepID=UPI0020C03C1D|nr:hypothetical protein [Metallosphaera sedula]BBL46718.1 mechanosensitive ion channel protein [Metallosphaera sedula]
MKTVQVALVVDPNGSPLSPEKQLAVALSKALSKRTRVNSITLIGWPILLLRMEDSGGYLLFDETGRIDTTFNRTVLGDYEHYLNSFSKITSPDEFLNLVRKIPWTEPRGKESVRLKGVISDDITTLLKNPSMSLPVYILERKITEDVASLEVEEWKRLQDIVNSELNKIDEYVKSFIAISDTFIGRIAEERRRIESLYDQEIEKTREELEQLLKKRKPIAYEEVKKKVSEFAPKLSEIYGVIAKTRLDVEGGSVSQKQISSLESAKDKLMKDLEAQVNQALEPYRAEIRVYREKIDSLVAKKNQELAQVDSKLEASRNIVNEVKSALESVKELKKRELSELSSLARRTIYIDEKLEVILPFLVVKDEYGFTQVISPLMYRGRNRSLLGFGSKLDNMYSVIDEEKITSFSIPSVDLRDNVRGLRQEIEKGIDWLDEEGWKVRKLFEDFYF